MDTQSIKLLFFAANLTFIVTNLYGWLLKWFWKPAAYSEHFKELYPAQRTVGVIYLLQIFELPYLFQIGNRDALLFVNAFALLFFALQMYYMCEGYFFPKNKRRNFFIIPAVVVLLPLFLQSLHIVTLSRNFILIEIFAVGIVFAIYFWQNIKIKRRIGRAIRQVNEHTYADSDDFPVHFAFYIQWIPLTICVLLVFNFIADDPWIKFVRDILFIFANISFCIYTLNPHRKLLPSSDDEIVEQMGKTEDTVSYRLSDERCGELSKQLEVLLTDEHIFTEQHITIDTLIHRLGINANYLTEVIQRSGYQSFYDMICRHRVNYAIGLIQQNHNELLQSIADRCGFSSQASMAKAFKSQGFGTPSSYRKLIVDS